MIKKQELIALFPELTTLIEEMDEKKIKVIFARHMLWDAENNLHPQQVMLTRSIQKYGAIIVIIRKFDDRIKYSTDQKHVITLKTIKYPESKLTYDEINTNDPLEAIKFIQSYFNDMNNAKKEAKS